MRTHAILASVLLLCLFPLDHLTAGLAMQLELLGCADALHSLSVGSMLWWPVFPSRPVGENPDWQSPDTRAVQTCEARVFDLHGDPVVEGSCALAIEQLGSLLAGMYVIQIWISDEEEPVTTMKLVIRR